MTLLVVDDNRSVLAAVKLLAEIKFDRVITTTSPSRIPSLLREETPDCVLLDMNFTSPVTNGNEGLYWLSEIRRISPTTPVVLFTAYAEIELAVQGLKEGAVDFISKPWNNARLLQTLLNAVSHPRQSASNTTSHPHPATTNSKSHPHQSTTNTISPHQSASSALSNT
ncbi:response regulator, partial [uncultured Duncaniella sp.]